MRSSKTPVRTVACVIGLSLMFVQAALAADKQPIRFNSADQAAAKAATLKAADLGAGWKGGAKKPDLTPEEDCPTKVSDLVITGVAESKFDVQGVSVTSQSVVLQSRAMVATDWQRTVGNAAFMACGRAVLMKRDDPKVRFVSFTKAAFPKLTPRAVRYRSVVDYGGTGDTVRAVVDLVLIAKGRTEISLILTTLYSERTAADVAERNLARLLLSRVAA